MTWRNIGIAAALLGAFAMPATTASAVHASSSANALRRFTPLYMSGGTLTEAQAIAVANNYNVVAEQSNALTQYVGAMHAANPNLTILVYVNGSFDTTPNGTAYPTAWYARDSKGNRIESTQFHNFLMLPSASWSAEVGMLCTAALKLSKYDGCFLDTLGDAPLDPGYVTGFPINPATHQVFTVAQWISAQTATIAGVKKANPGKPVIANGLADGKKFPDTQPLLSAAGTAMAELWLRVNSFGVTDFPSAAEWLQDVDMLITAASKGESILTVTKLWVKATTAQVAQWHIFTEASFLLGTNGTSAYCFSTSQTEAGLSGDTPWDHVAIGMPSGAMTLSGGIYRRSYSNGVVAVNPGTSSVTVELGGTFVNLEGKNVSTETLAAHTGEIFVK
jgi:hypothetical protein